MHQFKLASFYITLYESLTSFQQVEYVVNVSATAKMPGNYMDTIHKPVKTYLAALQGLPMLIFSFIDDAHQCRPSR